MSLHWLTLGSTGESQGHYLLGLRILNVLVTEMNQPTPGRTLTQHRKIAVSFRDQVRDRGGRERERRGEKERGREITSSV